jgi:hypothetical protein
MSAQSLLNTPNTTIQAGTILGNGTNLLLDNGATVVDIGGTVGNINLSYNNNASVAVANFSSSGNLSLNTAGNLILNGNIVTAPNPPVPSNNNQVATTAYINSLINSGFSVAQVAPSTTINFTPAFPAGTVPLVFVQNSEGETWLDIIFTVSNINNVSFVVNQFNITNPGTYEEVAIEYFAILPQ